MEEESAWFIVSPPLPSCRPQRHYQPGHVTTLSTACLSLVIVLVALPLACLALPNATDPEPFPCPHLCHCAPVPDNTSTIHGVTCSYTGISNVPTDLPDSILDLDLSNNVIQDLDSVANLTLLETLDVSNNALSSLQAGSLDDLFQLTTLDVSHNNIGSIEVRVFGALASIQTVNVANNKLQVLDGDQLYGLQTLKELNVSWNEIRDLSNSSFLYLTHLQVLDLSHNQLRHLAPTAFHGLQSLRQLLLHHNHLLDLTTAFHSLPQLLHLDLAHNDIQTIRNGTFVDLPRLTTLQLSFNNISALAPHFYGVNSSLKVLDLSVNSLQRLPGAAFHGLPDLKTLDLSQMPYLSSVSHSAFEGLHSVSQLNLSLNPQLSFLHPQALVSMTALTVLDLRQCNLTTLSHVTFHANPHLASLYLAHNPLRCHCGLLWALGPHRYYNTSTSDSIVADINVTTCQLQSDLSVPLTQMTDYSVNCSDLQVLNVTGNTEVRLGGSLLLTCENNMDETGVLMWITPRGLIFHYHPFHPDSTSHLVSREDATSPNSSFHKHHHWHEHTSYASHLYQHPDHIVLLSDGSLYVDYVLRTDAGPYKCVIHNAQYHSEDSLLIHLDYNILFEVKIMSLVVGVGCAATFFTLNTIYVVIMWAARKLINKRRRERIVKVLSNIDEYRSTQITRIRSNYSFQICRIRDHYHMQSTRLRDNYNTQMTRVKRGCSNQVDKIRDNYHQSLAHLKDYSSHQIQQIRDATNNQIVRIRDYGSLQMEKLRESYKHQSKHVMKVMEAMNLDNCRTIMDAECMRAESMMLDIDFPDFPEDDDDVGDVDGCSDGESIYATALNTDVSSQESLATMVEVRRVRDVTVEVLPPTSTPTITIACHGCNHRHVLGEIIVPPPEGLGEMDVLLSDNFAFGDTELIPPGDNYGNHVLPPDNYTLGEIEVPSPELKSVGETSCASSVEIAVKETIV